MSRAADIFRVIFFWLVLSAIPVWLMIRALKKSDEPAALILQWVLTAPVLGYLIFKVAPSVAKGGLDAIFGLIVTLICGLVLAIIWRHSLSAMIAKPFESLYDGGDQPIEPKPFYSVAKTHRMRGRYAEAIAEVCAQLARFPNDFEGQLLLAEIQAENLHDLQSAETTIQRLCNQPGHTPQSIASALNSLADWHLKFAQDREAARQAFEKIIALLPDSEMSAMAAQRIAHLAGTEHLLGSHDRKKLVVTPGVEDLGLLLAGQQPKAPEINPGRQAADYVKHLETHPLDTEAREKLALIYADHFGRLDLAADQLEQLVAHPNQPAKRVIHWLNRLADLQVKHAADHETVRQTLQRVVDLFPNGSAAEMAANRIAHLKLEMKSKAKSQAVKLGSYEQDIGLKRGSADQL